MGIEDGIAWLGLRRGDGSWTLPVDSGVISGASALFGGCATAAALLIAQDQSPQPVVWAAAHFGALAKLDTEVTLTSRVISLGRTMTHTEVVGRVGDRESFTVRVAAGERPDHASVGQWVTSPLVERAEACADFDHPVHAGTWAERFEWRLAGRGDDAATPWAAWWVRPRALGTGTDVGTDRLVTAAVLADYVTYGIGRALGSPMGGLSIDNVLRLHRPDSARSHDAWLLLEVRPEGVEGGFGHGVARLFTDGHLVATGSQSMIVNDWDWRLPAERST